MPAGAGSSYGVWQRALGERHGATLLAVRGDEGVLVSPSWDTTVPDGAVLYYVGDRRLSPEDLGGLLVS